MASPWPTSRITTRDTPPGRVTTTPVMTATDATSAPTARRWARDGGVARAAAPSRTGRPAAAAVAPLGGRPWRSTTATPMSTLATASPRASRGPRLRLANGTDAPTWTTPIMTRRATQPGAARMDPMAPGAPRPTRTPPASARTPTAIAGATIGTTMRLTAGATSASRPNETRITGRVAAWAASDTPRFSASQDGSRPRVARSIHAVVGVAHAMSPAVARLESWNPASRIRPGSITSRIETAHPRAAAARPARPVSRAKRTTAAMAPARRTDGDAPANATYDAIAIAISTDRRRRLSRPARPATIAPTIAMFQPEIATT